jgi:hypothetical protein
MAWGCLNAVAPGQLVHIVDQLTGRRFLIDTGANYSIFPHCFTSPPSEPLLTGASGQRIPCWGERAVQLDFHGCRFEWTFLLADVSFAIIGVDFLRSHKLLVDPAANCLVDMALLQSFAPSSHRCLWSPQGPVGETPPPAQPGPASHRRLRSPQGAVGETPPPAQPVRPLHRRCRRRS